MEFVPILSLSELHSNSQRLLTIEGIGSIVLFNYDGEITALGSSCLHKGGPLDEGNVEKKYEGSYYVTCPWHGWEYNIKTGKAPLGYEDQQSVYDAD
jgi:nitrite reductase/ring-hydroxylating ferredoxin subunit